MRMRQRFDRAEMINYDAYIHGSFQLTIFGDWIMDMPAAHKWLTSIPEVDFFDYHEISKPLVKNNPNDPDRAYVYSDEGCLAYVNVSTNTTTLLQLSKRHPRSIAMIWRYSAMFNIEFANDLLVRLGKGLSFYMALGFEAALPDHAELIDIVKYCQNNGEFLFLSKFEGGTQFSIKYPTDLKQGTYSFYLASVWSGLTPVASALP